MPRAQADIEAARMLAVLARNRGCLWEALRAALAGNPALLPHVPDKPGAVDDLPLGVPKLAVLKGGRVMWQGTFTGAQEVKARADPDA